MEMKNGTLSTLECWRAMLRRQPLLPAPMCGISDHAFRAVCRLHAGELAYTQMVSSESLSRGDPKTIAILDLHADKPESRYMCGTTDAGELAQEAGAKKLVLVHNTFIGGHGPMERAIADVAKVYDGEIIMGEELMDVPLEERV